MNKKKAHLERELEFGELRSYPQNFGTSMALKEMGAWIDNPDPDVRAFAAQKLGGGRSDMLLFRRNIQKNAE